MAPKNKQMIKESQPLKGLLPGEVGAYYLLLQKDCFSKNIGNLRHKVRRQFLTLRSREVK